MRDMQEASFVKQSKQLLFEIRSYFSVAIAILLPWIPEVFSLLERRNSESRSGEKNLWDRLLSLLNMPPQSRYAFHFQSPFLTLEISLVDRQTAFYKDCHWLSRGVLDHTGFSLV